MQSYQQNNLSHTTPRVMHVSTDATAQRIARTAYPDYTGRKIRVSVASPEQEFSLVSYWDGGSRDYYAVVSLADDRTVPVEQNGTMFDGKSYRLKLVPGIALVRHSIYCGKDSGITIFLHPDNATPALEAPKEELTWAERVVLVATRSLKSSYAGISDYRYHETHRATGITRAEWDTAKQSCIARGYLNSRGAITDAGRNASQGTKDLYWLGQERRTAVAEVTV